VRQSVPEEGLGAALHVAEARERDQLLAEERAGELECRNQSAAATIAEGIEETLTQHPLGIYAVLGVSFKTTNCIESANALVEERRAKVDSWKSSNQRQRWLSTARLDIEPRLRRVKGHRHLPQLVAALARGVNINQRPHRIPNVAITRWNRNEIQPGMDLTRETRRRTLLQARAQPSTKTNARGRSPIYRHVMRHTLMGGGSFASRATACLARTRCLCNLY